MEHGKAVPTWNYVVAHAHGVLRVRNDPKWLLGHLQSLTGQHENGRNEAWTLDDAPQDYLARQLKGVVGLEMRITRLEGKCKLSQNQARRDRQGVVRGLVDEHDPAATALAALIPE